MKGVVLPGNRAVEFRQFVDPVPGPGEVVIAMKASGLCGSDLRPYRGPAGSRPEPLCVSGHEPCGVVAEIGPGVRNRNARIGARVMIHHYSGCGVCKHCLVGYTQMCLEHHVVYGFNGHGGNAPLMAIPAGTLVPLPDQLSFAAGAAIACGTGTAYMAVKRLAVSGRDALAVFGQGPVGLSATMLARAMGARVIAIDIDDERLALAHELGAEHTINAKTVDPVAAIRDLTHGEGAETALDCTGTAVAREQAVKCARIWGRVCWVGEGGTVSLEPSPDVIHKQLTIYGSWTFSTIGLAECAEFIVDRAVPIERLITHRYRLDQAVEAFKTFDAGGTGKCVFLWE
ncbi:MAG: iditol 2-dehydrogenase [Chloroflexota bacterium]|nr:MAG: iditol 2-dehydrogenase [Chloroflexota bacterium]